MPDDASSPSPDPQRRGSTIIAAGLLIAALALVVLYTSRRAFLSPVALVVVAAIGAVALLLRLRMRPDLSSSTRSSSRAAIWLNALGVVFAVAAVSADILYRDSTLMMIAALIAVVSFAISGVIALTALRKRRS